MQQRDYQNFNIETRLDSNDFLSQKLLGEASNPVTFSLLSSRRETSRPAWWPAGRGCRWPDVRGPPTTSRGARRRNRGWSWK